MIRKLNYLLHTVMGQVLLNSSTATQSEPQACPRRPLGLRGAVPSALATGFSTPGSTSMDSMGFSEN